MEIDKIYTDIINLHEDMPWVFQKCSLRGLNLARNTLSDIREDSQMLLQVEIKEEYNKVKKILDDLTAEAKEKLNEHEEL